MRHPADGVLRRLLDEPAGIAEDDRRHVADCPRCTGVLATMRADARAAADALATDADPRVDEAWTRTAAAARAGALSPATRTRSVPSRDALRRPVAALAVAAVLAGAGVAAANDWLPIFRTERVAAVSVTTGDLVALPDLSAYGAVEVTDAADVHQVADAAAAEAETGLDVPEVARLPRGVRGAPAIQVGTRASATFTFSAARAASAAAAAGRVLPPLPPGLDGTSVRLEAGPGVAQVWSSAAGAPALLVGRAVAPTAYSSGVPFETLRDYLLAMPGLPEGLADQLRAFSPDSSTLPIPVPADRFRTSTADVDGVEATVLATRDRIMSAVVFVRRGHVTVVAGSLDEDEVLTVARELR